MAADTSIRDTDREAIWLTPSDSQGVRLLIDPGVSLGERFDGVLPWGWIEDWTFPRCGERLSRWSLSGVRGRRKALTFAHCSVPGAVRRAAVQGRPRPPPDLRGRVPRSPPTPPPVPGL